MVYFEKSQPSPDCLTQEKLEKNGDYKCGEVLERLRIDFENKCYICEQKEPVSINVEHLRPHQGDKDLKFDWNNLFWSCWHCNNTKSSKYTNIIDCTIDKNIENKFVISIDPFPKEKILITPLDKSSSTISTVELLEAVYNGKNKQKRMGAANLRSKILKEVKEFQKNLDYYYDTESTEEDRVYLSSEIQQHLSKASGFTAFKRWIIRKNKRMKDDFEQYFD